MKCYTLFAIALLFALSSCTLDKTDYEDEINTIVPEYHDFKDVISTTKGIYKIDILALNGTLYRGYNEIRIKLTNTVTNEALVRADPLLLPILTQANTSKVSYPHSSRWIYNNVDQYYTGYAVFSSESNVDNWTLRLVFNDKDQTFTVIQDAVIHKQVNKNLNMTAFTGKDGIQYIIALKAPQKPKVSENQLIAGIYKSDLISDASGIATDLISESYSEAQNYILKLDPRMPEPSMGNHSSPNNQDLKQATDGWYYGMVNYTMTGNWTLNLMLLDQNGKIIQGTPVSTDFTPGVEGAKSELHIDILF